MSIRDDMLPVLDQWRAELDTTFGLRQYDVAIVIISSTGAAFPGQPGSQRNSPVVTPLTVGGGARVKVSEVSSKDVIASGGLYQEQDLRIGPFTPPYPGGGTDPSVFDPPVQAGTEVLFTISGPGLPVGSLYKKIATSLVPGNFRYEVVLRKTGDMLPVGP